MTGDVLELLGGVGLMLFGLHAMTEALRELGGARARNALAGVTRRPLSGAVIGALTTSAVQSSTATMTTTVGFVGAGFLTFAQALGILYGASIGTTITGWLILFGGFRLPLAAVALPVLFAAALVRALAHGRWARIATVAAGLSLVFLGLDMMQGAVARHEGLVTPESFPPDTLAGRLRLAAIGVLVAVVIQSSSAGVAALLVLLGTGAVTFEQGAALVIGMHVGTTFTPLIAALGGINAVRRTAIANVIYHLATGALGLLLIDPAAALRAAWPGQDAQLALVAFHTGFNVVGAAAMLPLTSRFAALVARIVPERAGARSAERLDPRLLSEPAAALDLAGAVLDEIVAALFEALAAVLRPGADPGALAARRSRAAAGLEAVQAYAARIRVAADDPATLQRYDALLQRLDHAQRLSRRAAQEARMRTALGTPRLRRHMAVLRACLGRHARGVEAPARLAGRLARLETRLRQREARIRHRSLHHPPPPGGTDAAALFRLSDALRWMRRSTNHAQRILHYATAPRR